MAHAVTKIGGYDRTPDCRYIHPANPTQTWVSKARVHEVNPDATTALMNLLDVKGVGPKANKVNNRPVLCRIEDIRDTDFKRLAGDDPKLKSALGNGHSEPQEQPRGEQEAVSSVRALNALIRDGKVRIAQKEDGTLRALMTVTLGIVLNALTSPAPVPITSSWSDQQTAVPAEPP